VADPGRCLVSAPETRRQAPSLTGATPAATPSALYRHRI